MLTSDPTTVAVAVTARRAALEADATNHRIGTGFVGHASAPVATPAAGQPRLRVGRPLPEVASDESSQPALEVCTAA